MRSQQKIFKSMFYLNFKDKKLEKNYKTNSIQNTSLVFEQILNLLLIYIFLTFMMELTLVLNQSDSNTSKNLKWNLIFCLCNLLVAIVNYAFQLKEKKKISDDNNNFNSFLSKFIMMFCLFNNNMSLISILIVYFKCNLEVLSFTFILQMIMKFCVSFFVIKGFYNSLLIIFINILIHYAFLLSIHVIKAVYIYIVTEIVFSLIVISFVYLSEYYSRVFFYSFFKLEKEKEYNLETLKFFNISYFKSRNYMITHQMKMEELLISDLSLSAATLNSSDTQFDLRKIEHLFNTKFISTETELPSELESYLRTSTTAQNFSFSKLIDLMSDKKENFFRSKFRKFGIIQLKNEEKASDDVYLEMFLKFKLKVSNNKSNSAVKSNSTSDLLNLSTSKLYDVIKIEGMFIDVTQTLLKKKTQVNSMILAKYIHDIKTPLFLLKQVLFNYKKTSILLFNNIEPLMKRKFIVPIKLDDQSHLTPVPIRVNNTIKEMKNQTEYLKLISNHIFKLIESINMFTKHQNVLLSSDEINKTIQQKQELSKIDIRKMINSVVDFYNISIRYNPDKNAVKILSQIDKSVPQFVFLNKDAIRQVLMNLVCNSIKFTNQGEIKIRANVNVSYELEDVHILDIAVSDTGVGIDEANLGKLCTPYSITTDYSKGSGLGLSIVKDCLNVMGSKLNIFSKKNQGSCFSFEIKLDNYSKANQSESYIMSSSEDFSIDIDKSKEDNISKSGIFDNSINVLDDSIVTTHNDELITKPSCAIIDELFKEEKNIERFFKLKNDKILDDKFKIDPVRNQLKRRTRMTNTRKTNEKSFIYYDEPENEQQLFEMASSNLILKSEMFEEDKPKKTIKILLIDDDTIYSKQLSLTIKSLVDEIGNDIAVDIVSNPIEGLYKIYYLLIKENKQYDLMLCDENMPYIRGTNFVEFYKTLVPNGFYNFPIVSISGNILDYEKENSIGIYDFVLAKPCKKNELATILKKISFL